MIRTPTGIKGFDELIEGGIPQGAGVLLCGAPGTGKTIFALEFLYRGATQFGENGLFVEIEERPQTILEQARQFGWDFESLDSIGVSFIKIPFDVINFDIVGAIKEEAQRINAKRIVIDSLSILAINAQMYSLPIKTKSGDDDRIVVEENKQQQDITEEKIRQFIYLFVSRINELGATTIFIADSPEQGNYLTRDTVSEFVCDGIIKLDMKDFGKTVTRILEVKKMRSTKINTGLNSFEITNSGIVISKFNY